jgi:hypothetical protein
VTLKETVVGRPSLKFSASIENPLNAETAAVVVSLTPGLEADGSVAAGVGISLASAGVEGTLKVVKTDLNFSLTAKAADFPSPPLVVVDWYANLLSGDVKLYAEMKSIELVVNWVVKGINWFGKLFGVEEVVEEVKIDRYEKELFNFPGFDFPENQECQYPAVNGRHILYCSRREDPKCSCDIPPPPIGGILEVHYGRGIIANGSEVDIGFTGQRIWELLPQARVFNLFNSGNEFLYIDSITVSDVYGSIQIRDIPQVISPWEGATVTVEMVSLPTSVCPLIEIYNSSDVNPFTIWITPTWGYGACGGLNVR